MKQFIRVAATLIALTCFSSLLSAQQSPNLVTQAPLEDDARLQQKISLRVEGLPVSELLAILSRKTGILFTAQKDVGEEKVIAFTPANSLRDTLLDLATLFNDAWVRVEEKDKLARYQLIRPLHARALEDKLASGPAKRMMAKLDEQVRALEETPEQLNRRAANDVVRASLQDSERALATQLYALLTEEQKEQLFTEGHSINLSFSGLPGAQQEKLYNYIAAHTVQTGTPLTPAQFANTAVRLVLYHKQRSNEADVRVQTGEETFLIVRRVRDSEALAPLIHGNPYTREAVKADADLLNTEILKEASKTTAYIDALQSIFKATNKPIWSDYFRCLKPVLLPESDLSLKTSASFRSMDAFCKPFRRLWWLNGKTLLLRTRDWYMQRLYEVPDQWVLDVSQELQRHGSIPTYRDISRALELTSKQVNGLQRLFPGAVAPEDVEREHDGVRELLEVVKSSLQDQDQSIAVSERSHHLLQSLPSKKAALVHVVLPPSYQSPLPLQVAQAANVLLPALMANAYPAYFNFNGGEPLAVTTECDFMFVYNKSSFEPQSEEQQTSDRIVGQLLSSKISVQERKQLEAELDQLNSERIKKALEAPQTIQQKFVIVTMKLKSLRRPTANMDTTWDYLTGASLMLPLMLPENRRAKTEVVISP